MEERLYGASDGEPGNGAEEDSDDERRDDDGEDEFVLAAFNCSFTKTSPIVYDLHVCFDSFGVISSNFLEKILKKIYVLSAKALCSILIGVLPISTAVDMEYLLSGR